MSNHTCEKKEKMKCNTDLRKYHSHDAGTIDKGSVQATLEASLHRPCRMSPVHSHGCLAGERAPARQARAAAAFHHPFLLSLYPRPPPFPSCDVNGRGLNGHVLRDNYDTRRDPNCSLPHAQASAIVTNVSGGECMTWCQKGPVQCASRAAWQGPSGLAPSGSVHTSHPYRAMVRQRCTLLKESTFLHSF